MKKYFSVCLTLLLMGSSFGEKPKLEPFGFVKGDMYYVMGGVTSSGQPSIVAASLATGADSSLAGFTAQHTRFGFKGSASVDNIPLGGLIELDFWAKTANSSAKPRMRQAYAWCKPMNDFELRFGQQWDVFSPLNPTTNNTNANLWYNGNSGTRRPQFQLRYGKDLGCIKPVLQVAAGEATSEDELTITQTQDTTKKVTVGSWLGADNLSGIPLMEGRCGLGIAGIGEIGVAGLYASYTGPKKNYSTAGLSIDADLPLNNLCSFKGELAIGTNMNNAGCPTIGGNGNDSTKVQTASYWFNVISKPYKHLNLVAGFGRENVGSTVASGKTESNLTVYGDVIVPIGDAFSLSFEYQWIRTAIKNRSDPCTAGVIDIAGVVNF